MVVVDAYLPTAVPGGVDTDGHPVTGGHIHIVQGREVIGDLHHFPGVTAGADLQLQQPAAPEPALDHIIGDCLIRQHIRDQGSFVLGADAVLRHRTGLPAPVRQEHSQGEQEGRQNDYNAFLPGFPGQESLHISYGSFCG